MPPLTQASVDLSDVVAEALLKRCRAEGRPSKQEGAQVTTDGHTVLVKAKLDHLRVTGGGQFLELAVGLAIDGRHVPALDAEGVGVGKTREQAVRTAANEWSQTVGIALVRILAPEKSPDPKAKFRMEPGAAGVRGKVRPDELQSLRPQLRKALGTVARSLVKGEAPGTLHSFSITVNVVGLKGAEGECRVDGRPSPELSAAVTRLPWPPVDGDYTFKRVYLVRAK